MNDWHTHSGRQPRSWAGSPSGRFSGLSRRAPCPLSGCSGACSSRPMRCGRLWRVGPLRAIILGARSR